MISICGTMGGLTGCSAGADSADQGTAAAAQSEMKPPVPAQNGIVQTVRATSENTITVHSLPSARCRVHSQTDAPDGPALDIYTDDEGQTTFNFAPESAGVVARLQVDCTDRMGRTDLQPIELHAAVDVPALSAAPVTGRIRPALTGDPMGRSQNELLDAGYPLRPDPKANASAYAAWLKMVSQPATEIQAKPVVAWNMRADQATPNWAGYAVATGAPYSGVNGNWVLPNITRGDRHPDYNAEWVGIGGYNDAVLWQAGTTESYLYTGLVGSMTAPSFWIELLDTSLPISQAEPMIFFSGFDLRAGDDVSVTIWGCDQNGHYVTSNATYRCWNMQNLRNGLYSNSYACNCQLWHCGGGWGDDTCTTPSVITGGSAEWIMERPATSDANGVTYTPHLTNFGTAQMSLSMSESRGSSYEWQTYSVQSPIQLGMYHCFNDYNCGAGFTTPELATAATVNSDTLSFIWHTYD